MFFPESLTISRNTNLEYIIDTVLKKSSIDLQIFYTITHKEMGSTLESGIDVAPLINVASGKFDKKNKRSPLKYTNLCSKI